MEICWLLSTMGAEADTTITPRSAETDAGESAMAFATLCTLLVILAAFVAAPMPELHAHGGVWRIVRHGGNVGIT